MEEKNNQQKKEITLDDLALMMAKGFDKSNKLTNEKFEQSNKLTNKKIEALAILVQNEFTELKSELKSDITSLKDDVKGVKSDTEHIKAELNKKVDIFTHNDLKYRVEKLEKKFV